MEAVITQLSQSKRLVLRLRRYPVLPGLVLIVFVFAAVFAELFPLLPPNIVNLSDRLVPPFWQEGGNMAHLLGTDMLGRDVLSRMVYGARVSLLVGFLAIAIGGLAGTALGIIGGYCGGKLDAVIMRACDTTLAFPIILLALLLATASGPSLTNVVIALSVSLWARFARVVRGEVLSLKERDFIALAQIAGCSKLQIMFRHIFPNVMNTMLIMLTLQIGWAILVEASLSFLGAGVPPDTPSWGSMIARGREYITEAWWIVAFPGLAILVLVLSFNLLGDWLREAFDPKLREVVGG